MKVNCYKLEEVNEAIDDLRQDIGLNIKNRHGRLTGSAVIVIDESLIEKEQYCLLNRQIIH